MTVTETLEAPGGRATRRRHGPLRFRAEHRRPNPGQLVRAGGTDSHRAARRSARTRRAGHPAAADSGRHRPIHLPREPESKQWAPRFTFHGFRYAELQGWEGELSDLGVVAEVLHTDMTRIGWFDSSHEMLNKLHENAVWAMRGNFVDLPTDCPQRDERLGWTGDIGVFAPAAAFLYACAGTLVGWLRDVAAEQQAMGSVPNFVPWIECGFPADPAAAWGDAAVIVPWVLYERTGDIQILRDQLPSMKAWVDLVDRLSGNTGLWNTGFQMGDWLDPAAPPEDPGEARTDKYLIASAYFVRSSELLARSCELLGLDADFERYDAIHRKAKQAFQDGVRLGHRPCRQRHANGVIPGAGVRPAGKRCPPGARGCSAGGTGHRT